MTTPPLYPPEIQKWIDGQILLINKPYGWSSFDIVKKVRYSLKHSLGIKKIKVGHAGTLDPLASGLMIICIGKATKKIVDFQDLQKEYVAGIYLGATTPSFDLETEIDQEFPVDHITKEAVQTKLTEMRGAQMQMPPQFSAKWVDGKRAYKSARAGVLVDIKKQSVVLHELELEKFDMPKLEVRVACSKGTYIRSFANDLGLALNSGAHLYSLIRTQIGDYKLDDAMTIDELNLFFPSNATN